MKKLTARQEKFCYEYVIDLNATQAALRAGYSEKTAYSSGSRLLKNVEIQKFIQTLQADLEKTAGITALKVLKEHKKIAFSDTSMIREGWMTLKAYKELPKEIKDCIQEVATRETKYGNEIKIKFYDKQKSLDSISKILGFEAPTKIEQKIDFDSLTDEQVNSLIAKMTE
ncbi:terminase small subunit [Lascolabacillus massiliensis]|uniref:terminase small subunit n=1 Tax=Lascolabacillus massiliensis TaxID=1627894 RepID=UPI0006B36F45|nr:terminase small subunit [Lascolabacillus massiliensis]